MCTTSSRYPNNLGGLAHSERSRAGGSKGLLAPIREPRHAPAAARALSVSTARKSCLSGYAPAMRKRFTIGMGASEDRLERLIAERLLPGADKKRIDERIWELFGEEWCVMFTDLSGFSRRV